MLVKTSLTCSVPAPERARQTRQTRIVRAVTSADFLNYGETNDREDEGKMLETLDSVDWHLKPQPSWNSPDDIPNAVRALAAATTETKSSAYTRMLYALGNNHAGTYFAVVLDVIPFFGEILRGGTAVARRTTLDILVDLLVSFEADAGAERAPSMDRLRPLKELLKERTLALKEDLERLLASNVDSDLVAEILECVLARREQESPRAKSP